MLATGMKRAVVDGCAIHSALYVRALMKPQQSRILW
jgi:hypothetical protein